MGLLRFILAMTVVVSHSQPLFGFDFVGPIIAVQSFYIISGFYMTLILNEKYVGAHYYRAFIVNRFLRLFPAYWTVLILTLLMTVVFYGLFGQGGTLNLFMDYFYHIEVKSLIYIILTNIFIFGQDAIMFLQLSPYNGSLTFTSDFNVVVPPFPPAFLFLFVPQAWTLSIELLFYLAAPFLVRKTSGRNLYKVLAIISASLALRVFIYYSGLYHDPWTYRFFPTELAFFLFGSIAYRIYERCRSAGLNMRLYQAIFYITIGVTVFFQFIPAAENHMIIKQWGYYIFLGIAIPGIFIYTKDNKVDNYIGELSYPIYVSHLFILHVTTYKMFQGKHHYAIYLGSVALTVLFSMFLVYVIRPVERYRQKFQPRRCL